jgi:hypothetical protein
MSKGIVLRPARVEPPVTVSKGVLVFTGAAAGDLDHALQRQRYERFRSVARSTPASKR